MEFIKKIIKVALEDKDSTALALARELTNGSLTDAEFEKLVVEVKEN